MAEIVLTIVTVAYNSRDTIKDTVTSVMNFFHDHLNKEVEHLLIDGDSSDGTVDFVRSISNDVRILSEPDRGIFDAMNKGLYNARGKYVWYLNSDDYIFPNTSFSASELIGHLNLDFDYVYSDIVMIHGAGRYNDVDRTWSNQDQVPALLRIGWHPPHPAFICKKHVLELHGGFDTTKGIAADYKLMISVLRNSYLSGSYLPGVLTVMRLGGASTGSLQSILKSNLQSFQSLKELGLPSFHAFAIIVSKIIYKFSQKFQR